MTLSDKVRLAIDIGVFAIVSQTNNDLSPEQVGRLIEENVKKNYPKLSKDEVNEILYQMEKRCIDIIPNAIKMYNDVMRND